MEPGGDTPLDPGERTPPAPTRTGTKRLRRSGRLSKGELRSQNLDAGADSKSTDPDSRKSSSKGSGSKGSGKGARGLRRASTSSRAVPESKPSSDPMVGSTIEGKYKILEPIGVGGMAVVYKAWHLMLEKEVALKLIHPNAANRGSFRDRFYREARIASELVHENIVQTREFGETVEGRFYMLMDFCPGRPLNRVFKDGRLPAARAVRIVIQALGALSSAHTRSIVHRDIKPENIVVNDDDFARILDFGLAKILDTSESSEGERPLTRDGAVLGTPKYMSPEQAMGQKCDFLADIYSVGIVLYEAVTGKLPFDALTPAEMIRRHIVEAPKRPSQRVPGLEISSDLEDAIMKALAKKPQDRWESADAFKLVLEKFLRGGQVDVAVPISPEAFDHRDTVEVPGLDPSVTVHKVRHKARDIEGISWVIAPRRLSGLTVEGFLGQIEILRRVVHPALAPNLEAGAYVGEQLYAFSGWAEGRTLSEVIRDGAVPSKHALQLARPLLSGMAKAHEFGVNHLSICPALITVPLEGPVLHGLGIEPAARGDVGDPRSDVKALGLILLQLLAGRESPLAVVKDEGLQRAGGSLASVLLKATSDDPYPTAGAMLAALPSGSARGGSRVPLFAALGTVLLAVALGLAVAFGKTLLGGSPPGSTLSVRTTPNATVEVGGLGDLAAVVRRGESDSDGEEVFEGLPPGRYAVRITKSGFAPGETHVVLEQDGKASMALSLRAEAGAEPPPEVQPASDPKIGALMLKSLALQEPLCQQKLRELERALADAIRTGFDWTTDAALLERVNACRERLPVLMAARNAMTPTSPPAAIEVVSDKFSALSREIEAALRTANEGREAREALLAKVDKRRTLAKRWKKKVDRRSSPASAKPFVKEGREALDKGQRCEKLGKLEHAQAWYGRAIKEFARANVSIKELREVKTLLERFSEAVRSRNSRKVAAEFERPGDIMEVFDAIFRRGASVAFDVAAPTVQGSMARATVTRFTYIDRRADSRVVLTGYRVLLRKGKTSWKVVNVRRER